MKVLSIRGNESYKDSVKLTVVVKDEEEEMTTGEWSE